MKKGLKRKLIYPNLYLHSKHIFLHLESNPGTSGGLEIVVVQ